MDLNRGTFQTLAARPIETVADKLMTLKLKRRNASESLGKLATVLANAQMDLKLKRDTPMDRRSFQAVYFVLPTDVRGMCVPLPA